VETVAVKADKILIKKERPEANKSRPPRFRFPVIEMLLPKIIKVRLLLLTMLAVCTIVTAQTSPIKRHVTQNRKKAVVPRVGTIKDYPATGLMTGCANMYFEFANPARTTSEDYVFLSRAGGENAWMNLDGRDTQLALLKTTIWHKADESGRRSRYDYRAGAARLSVFIEPRETSDDYTLSMKIVVRVGRAVRVVKAVGSADC
jgi:hypothetical protein